jgi:hypothetical protein
MSEHSDTPSPDEEPSWNKEAYEGVYDAVLQVVSWPYASEILNTLHEAVFAASMTILPPKSHLLIPGEHEDDPWEKGADVVALRSNKYNDKGEAMTLRGDWIGLDDKRVLVVGR